MFLKNKITEYAKRLSKRMIITIILTLLVSGYLVVKAAFVEPSAAPADSDQDFAQNILGANNADNDFDSSSVAANRDGSIIEREEHIIDYLSNSGATCGNSIVEYNEGCDDGGTSWTAGACAGDCSRRNYWSSPSYVNLEIGAGTIYATENANAYCQGRSFRSYSSFDTAAGVGSANYRFLYNSSAIIAQTTATAANKSSFTRKITIYSFGWYPYSTLTSVWSSLSGAVSFSYTDTYYYQPSTAEVISEIWCAD